ncbi:hypothetical protein K469DRAFT_793205, partial [Zopfia rhizophila CBS 207.26]
VKYFIKLNIILAFNYFYIVVLWCGPVGTVTPEPVRIEHRTELPHRPYGPPHLRNLIYSDHSFCM